MKLIYTSFEKDSNGKPSFAEIEHKNKCYYGIAWVHPDDTDRANQYEGCRIAHERAIIKALKADYKEKKAACEECRKFVKAVTQYKNFNQNDPSAKVMFRQLNRRIKEVNRLADEINRRMKDLNTSITQREIVINAIERKKSKEVNK